MQSEVRDLHPAPDSPAHPGARSLADTMSRVPIVRRRAERFERPLVYFRFTPDEFILSVAGSEETYWSTPHVAVERHTQVVKAIGPEAPRYASQDVVVENGFRPDPLVISKMNVAEIAFRYTFEVFIGRVRKGQLPFLRWIRPDLLIDLPFLRWMGPDLLIHPLHLDSGQITELEMQALIDIGKRCGARNIAVYLGPELSDLELRTGYYVTAHE